MISVSNSEQQKIIEKVYKNGQDQVFRFWNELDGAEKDRLLQQIEVIDFELMKRLFKSSQDQGKNDKKGNAGNNKYSGSSIFFFPECRG